MDNVILKANELYESCLEAKAKLSAQAGAQNRKEAELIAKERNLGVVETDQNEREARIKTVEDPMNMMEQAKKEKKEANAALNDLQKEEAEFEVRMKNDLGVLATQKAEVRKDLAKVDQNWKQLRAAEKKLGEDRAKMKDDVMAEIKRKVG